MKEFSSFSSIQISLTTTTHAHCTHLILQVTKPSAITDLWVEVWSLFEWLKSVGRMDLDIEIMHQHSIRWKGKNHSLSIIFQDLRSHGVATGSTRALPRQEVQARPGTAGLFKQAFLSPHPWNPQSFLETSGGENEPTKANHQPSEHFSGSAFVQKPPDQMKMTIYTSVI